MSSKSIGSLRSPVTFQTQAYGAIVERASAFTETSQPHDCADAY